MFTSASEQTRRFGTEVAYFLFPSVEQTVDILGLSLILLGLHILLLGGRDSLFAGPFGLEVLIHLGKVALLELFDRCPIGRL